MKRYYYLFLVMLVLFTLSFCDKKSGSTTDPGPDTTHVVQTRFKTLNYLYKISGSNTVAGIHNNEPNTTPTHWTDEMYKVTGKYPALWSGDFLFQADNINNRGIMIEEAVRQWKKGSLINLMWHACNPALSEPCGWDKQGVLSELTDEQWTELTTDGTAINNKWKAMMDEVSVHLQYLEDNGVEVLFRPLHEMNQGAFWWGGRPGPNGTRKLYQITHDYFTKTKGLSNLIWVWDVQDFSTLSSDVINYNPGDEYWDVAALDVYDGSGYTMPKYYTMVNVANGKPIAIGECQKLPIPAELGAQPKWVFFMGWSGLTFQYNTEAEINALYNSSRVITLDKKTAW